MQYSYIIVDDDSKSILKIKSVMDEFSNYALCATASNYEEALNKILEFQPDFVFLEINPENKASQLSINIVNELHRYLKVIPNIIAISNDSSAAYEAVKFDVVDFLIKPFSSHDVRKTLLRFEKTQDKSVVPRNPLPRKAVGVEEENNVVPDEPIEESTNGINSNELNADVKRQVTLELHQQTENALLKVTAEIANLKEALLEVLQTKIPAINAELIISEVTSAIAERLPKESSIDLSPVLAEIRSLSAVERHELVNAEKNERNLICIKSYGDYRFLELNDIAFMKADNNSTDITMKNGEEITAFKTLKYFEENLPSNFYRIHNSYIVNRDYVSRVHTGNSVCYIKNSKAQVPFSKSYKELVEQMIALLAGAEFKDL